jgi:hypothetical protein
MNSLEFRRLRAYEMAARFAPRQAKQITSRRSAKSKATATGQHGLKSFRVVHEVQLETHFGK